MTTHVNYLTVSRSRLAAAERERDDLCDELDAIAATLRSEGDRRASAAEQARIAELQARATVLRSEIDELRGTVTELGAVHAARNAVPRAPLPRARRNRDDNAERAFRVVDDSFRSGLLPDYGAEKVTSLLEAGTIAERALAARWTVAAGAPEYRDAFAKLLIDPTRGHMLWTPEEADAYRAVVAVQSEMEARTAMSTTGANGGYMIPLTLDPAIMLTNDGSNNPLRQLATVKQTVTNTWQGVTSAGATAEWKAEADEAADGTPTLGNPSIPVFLGDSYCEWSYEVGMDAVDLLDELVTVLNDTADNLMAAAYTTGNGTTAPQGIVTGLAGTSSEINTTGSETYDDSDPFVLQNALPARFSANATFQAHIATMNAYRQMETTNGALMFPELRQSPPYLLGKRFYENSNMDGSINAAATANNYAMVYGDVARGFFIVDRVGTTIELIPNIMGANRRPTGQRGAMLWFRTGSEVVIPQALRLLDIPTAA